MSSLSILSQTTCGIVLTATLAACGATADEIPATATLAARDGPRAGNDCRAANAQSVQKGCHPLGYVVGRGQP